MREMNSPACRLTADQEAALVVHGASVALSAGAGCGKTTVLTECFLRRLDASDRHAVGQVVALTFTAKAARELRERVRRACRARIDRGTDAAHWRAVLRSLETAPIGTFHAYFARILGRFPIEAGVEPGFTIVEESMATSVRDRALDRCLRAWLADRHPDVIALAADLGLDRVRAAIADLVTEPGRSDYREWAERTADEIVAGWQAIWNATALPALAREFVAAARPCLDLLAANTCSHPVMAARQAFLLEHLPEIADRHGCPQLVDALAENARVQRGGSARDWPSAGIYEQVKTELESLRTAITNFRRHIEWDPATSRAAAHQGQRFARLAVAAIEAVDREKRALGILDFDDLQRRVRDLLRDGPVAVREQLAREIQCFLVDELQDTDPIQGEIIERLGGDRLGTGRLFLVGDTKQSIYRFRGAEPTLFDRFAEAFPPEGRIALNENFRSVPGVLDFINALFAETFPGEEHRLRASQGTAPGRNEPAVEFLWAHELSTDRDPAVAVDVRRKIEARWLARLIAQRLRDGRWRVRDPITQLTRAARGGDVVLLFRTLNDSAAYEAALAAERLDYHVVGGSAFFEQQEVLDVINLLSAIDDPHDELALAATLRSPFGCVSDDGLYWLATSPLGDVTAGFEGWNRIPDLSPEDRRRTGRLHRLMLGWRLAKDRVPIGALLDRALDDSGYEPALLGELLGPRKRGNVRKLVRLARRFDRQGSLVLGDFVAKLRADLRQPPREEQAAPTDEDSPAVRLMTIHQAKGLEFPVVIVPDLNRGMPRTTKTALFHPRLGILTTPADDEFGSPEDEDAGSGKSLGLAVHRQIEASEGAQEAYRLFYVAATRARDVLVLSAGIDPRERAATPAMRLLAHRFDRVTGACNAALPAGWPQPVVQVTSKPPPARPAGSGGRRFRPRLIAVSKAIERTMHTTEAVVTQSCRSRPRWLDLDPSASLTPSLARRDRLIRSILADPEAIRPDRLAASARRAARLQTPAAHPRLADEAVALLASWLDSPLARQIAHATEIHRAVPWAIGWPAGSADPTVYRGQVDFLFRDHIGEWVLVAIAESAVPESRERLRILLGARTAHELGAKAIGRAWRVRLDPDGGTSLEDRFDEREIDRAIRIVSSEWGLLPWS